MKNIKNIMCKLDLDQEKPDLSLMDPGTKIILHAWRKQDTTMNMHILESKFHGKLVDQKFVFKI